MYKKTFRKRVGNEDIASKAQVPLRPQVVSAFRVTIFGSRRHSDELRGSLNLLNSRQRNASYVKPRDVDLFFKLVRVLCTRLRDQARGAGRVSPTVSPEPHNGPGKSEISLKHFQ